MSTKVAKNNTSESREKEILESDESSEKIEAEMIKEKPIVHKLDSGARKTKKIHKSDHECDNPKEISAKLLGSIEEEPIVTEDKGETNSKIERDHNAGDDKIAKNLEKSEEEPIVAEDKGEINSKAECDYNAEANSDDKIAKKLEISEEKPIVTEDKDENSSKVDYDYHKEEYPRDKIEDAKIADKFEIIEDSNEEKDNNIECIQKSEIYGEQKPEEHIEIPKNEEENKKNIKFNIEYVTQYGEKLVVVGSNPELGN